MTRTRPHLPHTVIPGPGRALERPWDAGRPEGYPRVEDKPLGPPPGNKERLLAWLDAAEAQESAAMVRTAGQYGDEHRARVVYLRSIRKEVGAWPYDGVGNWALIARGAMAPQDSPEFLLVSRRVAEARLDLRVAEARLEGPKVATQQTNKFRAAIETGLARFRKQEELRTARLVGASPFELSDQELEARTRRMLIGAGSAEEVIERAETVKEMVKTQPARQPGEYLSREPAEVRVVNMRSNVQTDDTLVVEAAIRRPSDDRVDSITFAHRAMVAEPGPPHVLAQDKARQVVARDVTIGEPFSIVTYSVRVRNPGFAFSRVPVRRHASAERCDRFASDFFVPEGAEVEFQVLATAVRVAAIASHSPWARSEMCRRFADRWTLGPTLVGENIRLRPDGVVLLDNLPVDIHRRRF